MKNVFLVQGIDKPVYLVLKRLQSSIKQTWTLNKWISELSVLLKWILVLDFEMRNMSWNEKHGAVASSSVIVAFGRKENTSDIIEEHIKNMLS